MDLEQALETEILKDPDQYAFPIYRTHWRSSNFGRCYRYQYWYRKGVEQSNPPDMTTLRLFRVGDIFHADLQKIALLEKDEIISIEQEFKTEDVFGHADVVSPDTIFDIKTTGMWQWKRITKAGYDLEVDNEVYILQIASYAMFLDRPKAQIIFVQKDTYAMHKVDIDVAKWKPMVKEELGILRGYWQNRQLPPALPRAYNKKECNYCSFKDTCVKEVTDRGLKHPGVK